MTVIQDALVELDGGVTTRCASILRRFPIRRSRRILPSAGVVRSAVEDRCRRMNGRQGRSFFCQSLASFSPSPWALRRNPHTPPALPDPQKLGPQVGGRVPDFSLPDQHCQTRTWQSLMGPKGLVGFDQTCANRLSALDFGLWASTNPRRATTDPRQSARPP